MSQMPHVFAIDPGRGDLRAQLESARRVAALLGAQRWEAVVVVPSGFDPGRRAAAKVEVESSGVRVHRVVGQAVACVVARSAARPGHRRFLVVDFVPDAVDVSVVDAGSDIVEVHTTVSGPDDDLADLLVHALVSARSDAVEIDEVLVVGENRRPSGPARDLPRFLDLEVDPVVSGPETRLAGAALLAGSWSGHRPVPLLFEALPVAVCLVGEDGRAPVPVLSHGTPLPARRRMPIRSDAAGSAAVRAVRPVRGGAPIAWDLVAVELPDSPAAAVTVDVDESGCLGIRVSKETDGGSH